MQNRQGRAKEDSGDHERRRSAETENTAEVASESVQIADGVGAQGASLPPDQPMLRAARQNAIMRMQKTVGNQAVLRKIKSVQRTIIGAGGTGSTPVENMSERLAENPAGTGGSTGVTPTSYTTNPYGQRTQYQMSRRPTELHILVKIRFLNPPDATHPTGTAITDAGVQGSTRTICTDLATYWNNKFDLVGHPLPAPTSGGTPTPAPAPAGSGSAPPAPDGGTPAPAPSGGPTDAGASGGGAPSGGTPGGAPAPAAPTDIVLHMTFEAEPVFSLTDPADQQVFMHSGTDQAGSTAGGSSGVINSGNWYTSRAPGTYGTNPTGTPPASAMTETPLGSIYAHEYGHLLGIPDEYSRSNPAMHVILHGATPDPAVRQRMDDEMNEGVSRVIIMEAMAPQLRTALAAVVPQITDAIAEQHQALERQLIPSIRASWHDNGVTDALIALIQPQLAGQDKALAMLNEVVRFEAKENMSYGDIARERIAQQFQPANIGRVLNTALNNAIAGQNANNTGDISVTTPGGSVTMNVETRGLGGDAALQTAATSAAQTMVGAPTAPLPHHHGPLPPVSPSQNIRDQLTSLPTQWRTLAGMFNSADINADIQRLGRTSLAGMAPLVHDEVRALYRAVYDRFSQLSRAASDAAVQRFLSTQVQPLINAQIAQITARIHAEPDSLTPPATPPTPPGGVVDPAMQHAQDIQTSMHALIDRARAIRNTPELTPNAPTPGNPNPAPTVNPLNVRVTADSLMGYNHPGSSPGGAGAAPGSSAVRTDYMSGVVAHFNNPPAGATDMRDVAHETEFQIRNAGAAGGGGGGTGGTGGTGP